jgi:hypothetical protein
MLTISILTPFARFDPFDDMGWEPVLRHFTLSDRGASSRYTGLVDRFGRTGNERVPPPKILAFIDQPVGACFGKPAQPPDLLRCQLNAISNMGLPVFIVRAAARSDIKEPASDTGDRDVACILVFELDKTAPAAAVAECLPLRSRHFPQAFALPKWLSSSWLGKISGNPAPSVPF